MKPDAPRQLPDDPSGRQPAPPPPISEKPFRTSERLGRLARQVHAAPADPLTARQAAGLIGLTPSYFSTFFRVRVGVTFGRWLRTLRLRVAIRLLEETDLPMPAIASEAGFGSVRSMQRAFRELTGSTAEQHRRNRRSSAAADGDAENRPEQSF